MYYTDSPIRKQLNIELTTVVIPYPVDSPFWAIRNISGWVGCAAYIGSGRWVARVYFNTEDNPYAKPFEARHSYTTQIRALRAASRFMMVLIAQKRNGAK